MLPFFSEKFGNPSSAHGFGADVGEAVAIARKQVQTLLGAAFDHEIVFTSGGTESNSTALLSALESLPDRREIVTSQVEHPAVLMVCRHLEETGRAKIHYIGVDRLGRLDMEAYSAALSPQVALVSLMWANNETGTLFPVERLAEMAKSVGALFHTDAVQAVGKTPIRLKGGAIDMLSLSAHKLHGPKGVGALYVKRGARFKPFLRGGRQQRGRRAGTENTPGIVALGAAAALAAQNMPEDMKRIGALRDRLESGVLQRTPDCRVNGDHDARLCNTSNIAFGGVEAEALLLHLDRAGVAASSGSACASGAMEPSHVLRAMHVAPADALGVIRFSLSRDNDDGDVDRVLDVLPPIVEKFRRQTPD